MSPSKFYVDQQRVKKEINGARPSPLKIKKDSHLIKKSSPSSSSSTSSSSLTTAIPKHQPPPAHPRHPVIIYTHSPKVIHTKASDFMALVQKLTGLSRSDEEAHRGSNMKVGGGGGHDDNSSSSVVTDENSGGGGGVTDVHGNYSSSSISPTPAAFDHAANPYLSDVPVFTPTSSDFFCSSSRPYYRYPGNAIPPSMMEVMKGYQDYCN